MKDDSIEYLGKCLSPSYTINSDDSSVIETAHKLTQFCMGDIEKAVALFEFVRDFITYSVFMTSAFEEDFIASKVLAWGKGYCVQKSVLLAALSRAVSIPSRLGFADIRNYRTPQHIFELIQTNIFSAHCYTQFFLNGKWVSATSNFGKKMCERNGLPVVEFDGTSDAMLASEDLDGRPYIEYITRYEPQQNLDFGWLYPKLVPPLRPDKRPRINENERLQW